MTTSDEHDPSDESGSSWIESVGSAPESNEDLLDRIFGFCPGIENLPGGLVDQCAEAVVEGADSLVIAGGHATHEHPVILLERVQEQSPLSAETPDALISTLDTATKNGSIL